MAPLLWRGASLRKSAKNTSQKEKKLLQKGSWYNVATKPKMEKNAISRRWIVTSWWCSSPKSRCPAPIETYWRGPLLKPRGQGHTLLPYYTAQGRHAADTTVIPSHRAAYNPPLTNPIFPICLAQSHPHHINKTQSLAVLFDANRPVHLPKSLIRSHHRFGQLTQCPNRSFPCEKDSFFRHA